jgi:hypothetical protein
MFALVEASGGRTVPFRFSDIFQVAVIKHQLVAVSIQDMNIRLRALGIGSRLSLA